MTESTYCYLHMTPARIAAMDFFDELDERTIIGKVDDDEIEIPPGAMPPDPDDDDNLPSQIHPSFPYGNPFKDKALTSTAFPTNPISTRALYEDAEFEGVGPKTKRRWKDLGLDMLLPKDPIQDEEAKAKAARNSVHTSSRRVECKPPTCVSTSLADWAHNRTAYPPAPGEEDDEDAEDSDEEGSDEDEHESNPDDLDMSRVMSADGSETGSA